ncbi:hypothetical protein PPYR_00357 [Photinus pyralis]|uniref:OPA3-like protein n=1 Tax=Photinus pyralis TaxID=7054 RepID=A0A1Y1M905_PHOPY|nr:putative OPA3-like protein CG13603 [Photinus pyralis]KAB0803387.1 hypothetical protein PPYR_00357 [Photinus pyralis]
MVIGAFPAAKLGALLIKQISKPLANFIIHRAKESPFFRNYICMPPAQFYNWCEVKTKMWILNLGKPVSVPVLSEAMAIELGANLLGEGIIFSIAASILIFEWRRSSRKEALIEENKQNDLDDLKGQVQELFLQLQEQQVLIKELTRLYYKEGHSRVRHTADREPKTPPPSGALPTTDGNQLTTTTPIANDKSNDKDNTNVLMRAVTSVEEEFLVNRLAAREAGILTSALNYIYQDVYRIPLVMQ